MVPLDQPQKLPNLIAFCLSMSILHIQQLVNVGMHEDVMTPSDSGPTEIRTHEPSGRNRQTGLLLNQPESFGEVFAASC
jgi:hypothetical protein